FSADRVTASKLKLRLSGFADGDHELALVAADVPREGQNIPRVVMMPLIERAQQPNTRLHGSYRAMPWDFVGNHNKAIPQRQTTG
ncbi:MAG: hypothetical protein GY869_20865, partial [Planctomycetes bacterium]|nr:hypothetical protein [Planctomycetota bacterium]